MSLSPVPDTGLLKPMLFPKSTFCSNTWPLTLVPDTELLSPLVFPG